MDTPQAQSVEEELLGLIKKAWEQGITVTVTQHSLPPYAMGHYYTRISTREARGSASCVMLIMMEDDARAIKETRMPS
jgi:hypothetical protein